MSKKVAHPVGLKCTNVRWLTDEEKANEGWEHINYHSCAVLEFSDGSVIYASCDPEGNAPGALFGSLKDGQLFTVTPLEDI